MGGMGEDTSTVKSSKLLLWVCYTRLQLLGRAAVAVVYEYVNVQQLNTSAKI